MSGCLLKRKFYNLTLRLFQQSLLWWYKNQISYANTLDKINKNKELIETLIKLSFMLEKMEN